MNETTTLAFDLPPVPPPIPPREARLAFTGRRADFRRLVIRGTALELVTVGFYRFWLATDMRRHLWSNTAIEGYKMRHTAYGNLQGSFVGDGWSLFKKTWWLWLLLWPSLIIMIPAPFIWAELKAIEWRWWLAGVRIGEVSFTSKLRNGALID